MLLGYEYASSLELLCGSRWQMDELKTDQGKTNEHQELPMPLTSKDLIVLMRCLVLAPELNQIKESDKEVVRNLAGRIKRYVERQGAYWDE
jgi:hypothetical protein